MDPVLLPRQPCVAANHANGENEADMDPIASRLSVNKLQIKIGEELPVTITAVKQQNWGYKLSNQFLDTEFRIKVLFPDQFEQTGDNYTNFVEC